MAERLPDRSPRTGQAPIDPRAWDDATLVAALRREERLAFVELYDRFAPRLVRLARLWGIADGEREPLAAEVLGDVALALARHAVPAPQSLAAYLATSLRRRVGAAARGRARRARLVGSDGDAANVGRFAPPSRDPERTGGIGALLCSEHARRASDPAWAPTPLDPAVARLADHLAGSLPEDDRRLLVWLAHDVPLRTAAEWLGVRYDAAGKRAQRLRARLRARAERYVGDLADDRERRAVRAFLRRAASPVPPPGDPPQRGRPAAGAPHTPPEESER